MPVARKMWQHVGAVDAVCGERARAVERAEQWAFLVGVDAGCFAVGVDVSVDIAVLGNGVLFSTHFVKAFPAAFPVLEIVLNAHPDDGADARARVDNHDGQYA